MIKGLLGGVRIEDYGDAIWMIKGFLGDDVWGTSGI